MNQRIFPIKSINKRAFLIYVIPLSGILLSMNLYAEQHSPQLSEEQEQWIARPPTFSELDKNLDNYLSKEEAKSWEKLYSKFDEVDKNGDQKIDRTEFNDFETHLIEESILEFTE
ncbi:hypothetical protein [Nitrosococcus oceani]|uniref:EF-hand domain-containing protein n=2 Tax=Nitrosococcus oceani TaxID=1229 RepID=Q3JCF7_NITOC|nr:hypothetical protein [Nitrosococcus oceani]ABA57489.1 hypothetical protein Noc_0979 [Nitrosococcus oceani ATCC 19707]KFI19987.1 hypothetical protein IB75_05015 [Nitrosococcus oceani C-27]KFI23244.1 hypothetical protein HW44_04885 [Nitrosococcus oceani]GEM20724.1 hypothetical protein NONS58_21440 [Nitrosococcus oceani]